MKLISKSMRAMVLMAALGSGAAQAGAGPCMPMFMGGANASGCTAAPFAPARAPACPSQNQPEKAESSCQNSDMAGMMGGMMSGGMNIAVAVMGAIFGEPLK